MRSWQINAGCPPCPPLNQLLSILVVDTNVIVRGLLSPHSAATKLLDASFRRQVLLVTSCPHRAEIHKVLARPRFVHRYKITREFRQRIIRRLYTLPLYVQPTGQLRLCRDPKDDYLIEMALLTKAVYLVSEDSDLHDDANRVALLWQNNVVLVHVGSFVNRLAK